MTSQQIDLINSLVEVVNLKKGSYFSEAGKIVKHFAIVNEGILRVCYYDKQGNEVTRYFIEENNLAVDLNSFNYQIPSSEYVEAVVSTKLYVFSKPSLKKLSDTILVWDNIQSKIINSALLEKVNRISPMLAEDSKTRYLEFHKRYPTLVNRIPLNYLASYIGVTKHTLSRIRKEISR
ncbi:Crp/Fnr family transcriptional regulator [Aquimarina sp. LLG6339-5]|uniref:Crp/Fnr family transcriptional regulator n=1 Tax=Aquimarina sp. LLG6339-5 TaxID=3160830 RepID=UPI003869F79E